MAKKLTKSKARKILHDKEVHGHPLTEQQRKFFGAIAGGAEPYKAQIGTMLTALPSNMMDRLSDALAFPQKAVTKLFTGKYQTPSEAMNIQSPAGAIAADILLDPLSFLGGGAGASKAARAVKQSTKTGVLSKAHKLNPLAFKPNEANWYRQVGKSAIDDAFETGLVREAGEEVSPRMLQEFENQLVRMQGSGLEAAFAGRKPASPYFAKGELFYPMGRKPTVSKRTGKISKNPAGKGSADYLIETDLPNESFQPAYVKGMGLGVPTEVGQTAILKPNPSLRNLENFKFYTQDWLRGYKQVKPPKKKQDGGWLDKYDAPQAQNGIEGTMGGLTDVGFNYNGAWGGTMQMGGSLPGAVGFTYARTAGAAPANGPYAKKTKASAQNGQEMKYYQAGLDFKPKTISQNGSAITTDINDYRRWQDSVRNYIRGQKDLAKARADVKKNIDTFSLMSGSGLVGAFSNLIQGDYQGKRRFLPKYKEQSLPRQYWGPSQYPQVPKDVIVVGDPAFDTSKKIKGLTEALEENKNLTETNVLPYSAAVEIYHPPVRKSLKYQPPVKKQQTSRTIGPFPIIETPRRGKYVPIPKEEIDLGYELPVPNAPSPLKASQFENKPTKYTFTYPTGKYNEQKTMYFPTKSALKSFVEGVRGATYQEGKDYASATGTLQDGGDIPVDPMGYWNPENVGNPVIIPSNVITMEGVDQPLLGISDTGDVQYMEPGEDYEFDGEYVTEYPVAQAGKRVPIIVSDPKDPRLKAYQDSLSLYKGYRNYNLDKTKPIEFYDKNDMATLREMYPNTELIERKPRPLSSYDQSVLTESGRKTNFKVGKTYSNKELVLEQNKAEQYANRQGRGLMKNKGNLILDWKNQAVRSSTIAPIGMGYGDMKDIDNWNAGLVTIYKKPVQPVEYRKPEPKQEMVKKPEPVVEKKAPLTDYFQGTPIYAPAPYHGSGAGSFVGYRTPQGDTVFVKPEDYERMGVPKYGREFIESQTKKQRNGGVNNADAQPLKKLDQLLNFTNYNKPTKGGWLDKYN